MSIVDTVRRPEYTGENRCIPCTIANVAIAFVVSVGVGGAVVVGGVAGPTVAVGAGVVVLALSLAAIYLRGYLVPGTPTLTKRYFPDWVLARFDKLESPPADAESGSEPEVDAEQALLSAGAVRPCEQEEDLCLDPGFGDAWDARIRALDHDDVDAADVLSALGMDDGASDAGLRRFDDAVILERDHCEIGKWESQAALVADVAAADGLAERYDGWHDLDAVDRSKLLRGLRIFVEECPLCSGPISLGQDTVKSCCRSYDVVAVTCDDCGSRLFEERWSGAN